MTHEELDRLWFQAMEESIKDGEMVARYHFADLVIAALKETVPSDCTDSHQPVAWYHIPHPGNGISPMVSLSQQREPSMYGAVVPLYLKEECYGKATNSEPFTVYTTLRQREIGEKE